MSSWLNVTRHRDGFQDRRLRPLGHPPEGIVPAKTKPSSGAKNRSCSQIAAISRGIRRPHAGATATRSRRVPRASSARTRRARPQNRPGRRGRDPPPGASRPSTAVVHTRRSDPIPAPSRAVARLEVPIPARRRLIPPACIAAERRDRERTPGPAASDLIAGCAERPRRRARVTGGARSSTSRAPATGHGGAGVGN